MPSISPDGCIETSTICSLAGIKKSTLDYWVLMDLVRPTVRANPGRRRSRLWTVEDAVLVRAIKVLREAGCPVRLLRRAREFLDEQWRPLLGARHLYWDGSDLFRIGEWAEVESIVKNPGQRAFHVVVVPVDAWAEELVGKIVPLPSSDPEDQATVGPSGRHPRKAG